MEPAPKPSSRPPAPTAVRWELRKHTTSADTAPKRLRGPIRGRRPPKTDLTGRGGFHFRHLLAKVTPEGHECQQIAPACWPATLLPRWGAPGEDLAWCEVHPASADHRSIRRSHGPP